jgi:predicted nucleic acid-binding protein
MMRVLLDTNILLDVLLKRIPWQVEAELIFKAAFENRLSPAVTGITIANLFYIGRKQAGLEKAQAAVRECQDAFDILPVDHPLLESAVLLPGSDLEDNIQIAAAERANLETIVSKTPQDYTHSPLPVLTPQELVAKLYPEMK